MSMWTLPTQCGTAAAPGTATVVVSQADHCCYTVILKGYTGTLTLTVPVESAAMQTRSQ